MEDVNDNEEKECSLSKSEEIKSNCETETIRRLAGVVLPVTTTASALTMAGNT